MMNRRQTAPCREDKRCSHEDEEMKGEIGMKKRILAVFLAAVMMTAFAACESDYDEEALKDDSAISYECFLDKEDEQETEEEALTDNESGDQTAENLTSNASEPDHQSATGTSNGQASGSGGSGNSSKPVSNGSSASNQASVPSGSGLSDTGAQGNNTNTGNSETAASPETESPQETQPPVHTHNFVDVGVQSMDWSGTAEPGETGPTNTHEKLSVVNACLGCGFYYGNDEGELFADRYYDHIWGPNASDCGGAYTAAMVYAHYYLLACTDPNCHSYRRGDFAYYEYTIYFDGFNNPGTRFILEDWQMKELGLPML